MESKNTEKKAARKGQPKGQWIRTEKRFAIYRRDHFRCCYCGADLLGAPGPEITLDHVTARELGGCNDASNLVTCCKKCNSSKQDKTMRAFLKYLRNRGVDTTTIPATVRKATKRALRWEE
jgi:5-methylcytosine-specific restriction endonuclease McrA